MKNLASLALAVGLFAFAMVPFALAMESSDCKSMVPVSPFGPDDQTGATNRITPAVTKAAAAEIQEGKVITMTNMLVDGVPLFGTRFTKTVLSAWNLIPGGAYGTNNLTFLEDTWLSQSHVGTHLDGMGHIGVGDCFYNQTPIGKFATQNRITRLGLENLKSFATRGVIIDAVKVFQQEGKLKSNPACRKPCLDGGTVITDKDIEAGLKMYNVTLREGDVVIIHSGWEDLFLQYPKQNDLYNSAEPGIGKAAARYLIAHKVVAVGMDNWAVDVAPAEDPKEAVPVHQMLLTQNGIHILENVRTDLIAEEAARTGRSTFFFNMTVPKAVGTTGIFVAPEAIR